MKVERDYLWKRYTFIPASKEDEKFLDVFNKYIDELEKENSELKHKNELQEKALIRLCLKHHYDSIIIEWEEVIDMSNYKVVEKKKPQEEKLF